MDQFQGNQVNQGNMNMGLEPHRGTMILIFGIVGIIACAVFAVLAWIFGNQDLNKMNNGMMDPSGKDITNIGKILGIIGVCLWGAGILIWILVLIVSVAAAM